MNEISWGDLDEMIDFQNLKSRDLSYFSRNFLELVMHGYTILNGGDLDENGIMFFCIWQYSENSPQGLAICCPDLKLVISPRCVRAEFHRSLREFCRGPVPDIRAGCNHVYFN